MNKTSTANSSSKESLQPLFWLLAGYALFFWALACRKYNVMNSNSGDASAILNAFWYTIHGKFFFVYFNGISHFGIHVTPAILVCLPFFWLAPSMYTLLFMQSLVLAASGWPFYLVARQTLENKRAAYFMTIGYLFFPTVVTNHVNQIH